MVNMSRIGKKPVQIPENVSITQSGSRLTVKGPKGPLTVNLPHGVKASLVDSKILVSLQKSGHRRALGKIRSEIANAVTGVGAGWQKTLEIFGTGYRASLDGQKLILNVGFSHSVEVIAPGNITFEVQANKITVSGIDKVLVGQMAATIRKIRPAEPYKGKGLRYENEVVRKKPGKSAKGIGGKV